MGEESIVVYRADALNSVDALQDACNYDEAYLGKLIKIEIGALERNDGDKAIAITYKRVGLGSGIHIGHLILKSYTTDGDAALKTVALTTDGATPVLPGDNPNKDKSRAEIFIGHDRKKILVFREKQ